GVDLGAEVAKPPDTDTALREAYPGGEIIDAGIGLRARGIERRRIRREQRGESDAVFAGGHCKGPGEITCHVGYRSAEGPFELVRKRQPCHLELADNDIPCL